MSRKPLDLTKEPRGRFGRLKPLEPVGRDRWGSVVWRCQCDCGRVAQVSARHLTRKRNPRRSCGCLRAEKARERMQAIRGAQLAWAAEQARSAEHSGKGAGE